jgi:hypothetical protein
MSEPVDSGGFEILPEGEIVLFMNVQCYANPRGSVWELCWVPSRGTMWIEIWRSLSSHDLLFAQDL